MAFLVGESVVAQLKGGQSGTKAISPPFDAVVLEVLPNSQYLLDFVPARQHGQNPLVIFHNCIANESDLTAA